MLFKMLLIERGYILSGSDAPRPRQVFVTQSRVLAGKVQEYFIKLADSLKVAEWTLDTMVANRHALVVSNTAYGGAMVHVDDLVEGAIEVCGLDVHLLDFPVVSCSESEESPDGGELGDWSKSLVVVNTRDLSESLSD